jgi:phage terminase large subunit-like protein
MIEKFKHLPPEVLGFIRPGHPYPGEWPPLTESPVDPLPSAGEMERWGEEATRMVLWERHWAIERSKSDPLKYGFVSDQWRLVEAQWADGAKCVLIMGGNRSSKTHYASRKVVETLTRKHGARAWCFQTTGPNSIEMQQPYIHQHIPPEWRDVKKGKIADVTYRRKTGFSEGTFILPNESQCVFRNYAQDVNTIEGGEIDIAWCDELVPLSWLETIRYRLVTRNGILIVTFTPIEGYNATVKEFLQGAETVRECAAPLLPKAKDDPGQGCEMVPRLQMCRRATDRVVYFHTSENPWSGYERIKEDLRTANREQILCRAYGVPVKAIGNQFPRFNRAVHVIARDKVPKGGTWYQVVDPCSGRNFFMVWAVVTPDERLVIAREWPQPNDYIEGIGLPGDWAEPDGKLHDGRRGDAQRPFGFGIDRYKQEIERVEKALGRWCATGDAKAEQPAVTVFERSIDSRFGNAPTLGRAGTQTLIDDFQEIGVDFLPAPGEEQAEGIDKINSFLDYDVTRPVDALNQPRLYVCEDCRNTIFALQEWTGKDGKHGACKDPIDVLRYLVLGNPVWVGDATFRPVGGGSY